MSSTPREQETIEALLAREEAFGGAETRSSGAETDDEESALYLPAGSQTSDVDMMLRHRVSPSSVLSALVLYVTALVSLIVLDAVWMRLVAPLLGLDYYAVVKSIQGTEVAARPAGLIAYLIMGYAAAFMAPSAAAGAQLGFVIYGVFDFTSTFMYAGWTLPVAVLDCIWGTTVYALTGALLSWVRRAFYHSSGEL